MDKTLKEGLAAVLRSRQEALREKMDRLEESLAKLEKIGHVNLAEMARERLKNAESNDTPKP